MLMIEGDDVAALRETSECLKVRVVAYLGDGHHLCSRGVGAFGQQMGLYTKPDCCLLHHPGQLPAPDNPHPVTTTHEAAAYYSGSGSPSKIRSAITTCTLSTPGTSGRVSGFSAAVSRIRVPHPKMRSRNELS